MYLKLVGCKILEREIASVIFNSPNAVDVTLIKQKYHETQDIMRRVVQKEIDLIDDNASDHSNDITNHDFDAILLGFGFCSRIVAGLSSKKYKLVIPRVHDCISLLMGDRNAYAEYAAEHMDTFYYSPGYAEHDCINDRSVDDRRYQMYLERFKGREKLARRAMEIEKEYTKGYSSITYINWDSMTQSIHREKALQVAEEQHWELIDFKGNDSYLRALADGEWDEERFAIVPPGYTVTQAFDGTVLQIVKCMQ